MKDFYQKKEEIGVLLSTTWWMFWIFIFLTGMLNMAINSASIYAETCTTTEAESIELRSVKVPHFFWERTNYFIRFDNGKFLPASYDQVANYQDGDLYRLTTCAGGETIERIEQ